MKVVVDASVCLKWVFWSSPDEGDVATALGPLRAVETGRLQPLQPPHWIAEVQAVVARRQATGAQSALAILTGLHAAIVVDDAVYLRACEMAARLKQHLFDTLYHAVALERDAVLVTADDRYFAAARGEGRIERLTNFSFQPDC